MCRFRNIFVIYLNKHGILLQDVQSIGTRAETPIVM